MNDDEDNSIQGVKTQGYNRLVQLMHREEFKQMINGFQELFSKEKDKLGVKLLIECQREIATFLRNHTLPNNWLKPILNFIQNNQFDFPKEEGISLFVGPDEITHRTKKILIMVNKATGKSDHDDISIRITSKSSINKIKNFIDEHSEEIRHWQKIIDLPECTPLRFHNIDEALEIAELKDGKGKTFTEIADIFSLQTNTKHLTDENTLKTIYYRYKKLFVDISE